MRTIPDFHGQMRELTEVHEIREAYTYSDGQTTWTGGHTVRVPPLMTQLEWAIAASTGASGAGFGSRPAANLEAVDTWVHIDHAAARWVRDLGEDDPKDGVWCLRKLHGLHASAGRCGKKPERDDTGKVICCAQHMIEADTRRWWNQARITTGWDSPAFRPNNTCPLCGRRGGLRLRVEPSAAMCAECRETWDETTIGLLVDHIRAENDDPEERRIDPLTQAAYAVPEAGDVTDRHADSEAGA